MFGKAKWWLLGALWATAVAVCVSRPSARPPEYDDRRATAPASDVAADMEASSELLSPPISRGRAIGGVR